MNGTSSSWPKSWSICCILQKCAWRSRTGLPLCLLVVLVTMDSFAMSWSLRLLKWQRLLKNSSSNLGTNTERLQLLHEVQLLVALQEDQGIWGPVRLGVDDGAQVLVFPHSCYLLSIDGQWAKSWGISPEIHHCLLGLGDDEKEVVDLAPALKLLHSTAEWVFTCSDETGQRHVI